MIDESEANIFISGLRPTRWHWVTEHRKNFPVKDRLQPHKVPPVPELCDVCGTYVREKMCVLVFGGET